MILPFPERIRHSVSGTPGTGAATLGSNVSGFQSLSNSVSGVASGQYVVYEFDDTGPTWENGEGLLTLSSGTWTLTRTNPIESSSGPATAISLTSAALVSITLRAIDVADLNCGFVNKFRNAGMDVAQRGTSGTMTTAGGYTLDGWIIVPTGASVFWEQQWCNQMKGDSLALICASGIIACTVGQSIESYLAADLVSDSLAAQPITVQWLIFNDSGASFTPQVEVAYANARDNFSSSSIDLSATNLQACPNGAFTRVSLTFKPTNPSYYPNGIQVALLLGGALNNSSGALLIGRPDIRLTPGRPVGLCYCPPRPEIRPVHQELAFCQRYYQTTYPNGVAPGSASYVPAARSQTTTANYDTSVVFPVQMRAAPASVGIWDYAGNSGYGSLATVSTWTNEASAMTPKFYSASGFVAEQGALHDVDVMFHYAASAEL